MTRLCHSLISLALALPLAVHAGDQALERTSVGHLATQVQISGHGAQLFVVDTGASATAIYEHARVRMGLAPVPGPRIQMHGAAGWQMVDRYRLPRLSVAGIEADRLLVSGLPRGIKHGEEVMGVLGRDVLGQHLVELDLVSNRLALHPPGRRPASSRGWNEVPIALMPHLGLVTLQVAVDGAKVTAVLDTGARKSFLNWRAARAAGATPETEGQQPPTSTAGGVTGHRVAFGTREFKAIGIGATSFRPLTLAISDLPVFVPMGMDRAPGMIVGLDLLGDRRFVIDYPARRLLIER